MTALGGRVRVGSACCRKLHSASRGVRGRRRVSLLRRPTSVCARLGTPGFRLWPPIPRPRSLRPWPTKRSTMRDATPGSTRSTKMLPRSPYPRWPSMRRSYRSKPSLVEGRAFRLRSAKAGHRSTTGGPGPPRRRSRRRSHRRGGLPLYLDFVHVVACRISPHDGFVWVRRDPIVHDRDAAAYAERARGHRARADPLETGRRRARTRHLGPPPQRA